MLSCARRVGLTATLTFCLAGTATVRAQAVLHVDVNASGSDHDGLTWCTAFVHLQDALAATVAAGGAVTEILVADGVYQPDQGGQETAGSRWATFQLINGVGIRGGYAGCGAGGPDERDIALYESILSGDLDGDDVGDLNDPSRDENSLQVVSADASIVDSGGTVLDGFTITAGNADGGWDRTDNGGGIRNVGGNPTVSRITFLNNSASNTGGAFSNWSGAAPRIINCVFLSNKAGEGGAMWNVESEPTVINCLFLGNAARAGAGVYHRASIATMTNCTFVANVADVHGPAVACDSTDQCCPSTVEIHNSILWNGGAEVSNQDDSGITITHSDIQGGWSGDGNIDDLPLFIDSVGPDGVAGTADDDLRLSQDSPCIDVGQNASVTDPTDLDGNPRIVNGDLVGTAIADMGAYEYQPDCNTNSVSDALDILDGTSGDCNENGVPDECDIDGSISEDQNENGVPDECEGPVLYVDDDAEGAHNGYTWGAAFTDLQDALEAAAAGLVTDIHVAEGIYTPDRGANQTPGDREAAFEMINGVAIKGGFAGWGADDPDERNIFLYETVLSGDLDGDDEGGPGDPSQVENSYHVVTGGRANETAVIDGFVITAGNADAQYAPHYFGGAMYIDNGGRPTVRSCIFRHNYGKRGGGIYNHASRPTFSGCTFSDNRALLEGGGMYNENTSRPILTDCTFSGNAGQWGGGMYNIADSSPELKNCAFIGNTASLGGGIANTAGSHPALNDCWFAGNSAQWGGGICNTGQSNPILISCAFSGNVAGADGGGIYNLDRAGPMLFNCTFSGNSAGAHGSALACDSRNQGEFSQVNMTSCILWDGGGEVWNNNDSIITIRYSDVQGGWPGTSNLDADPLFIDDDGPDGIPGTDDDDLRLSPESSCVNTGDPMFAPRIGQTDLDGNPRVQSCRVDRGGYESSKVQPQGDFDGNLMSDLADFAGFQLCYNTATANPAWQDACLCIFDFDGDNAVDASDYLDFHSLFVIP